MTLRVRFEAFCSPEDLGKTRSDIQVKHALVQQLYEPIHRNRTATPKIAKWMDACVTLTSEICDLISKWLENVAEPFNDQVTE